MQGMMTVCINVDIYQYLKDKGLVVFIQSGPGYSEDVCDLCQAAIWVDWDFMRRTQADWGAVPKVCMLCATPYYRLWPMAMPGDPSIDMPFWKRQKKR